MATVTLSPEVEQAIRRHGEETYPDECCGALVAREGGVVVEAVALANTTREGSRRRFLVGPVDYRSAERRAAAIRGELVGFYHSHPDHPAEPSEFDRLHGWPNFSYVIASVRQGRTEEIRSWRLREDREGFEPEEIRVLQPAPDG